jgi:hypothetical protein
MSPNLLLTVLLLGGWLEFFDKFCREIVDVSVGRIQVTGSFRLNKTRHEYSNSPGWVASAILPHTARHLSDFRGGDSLFPGLGATSFVVESRHRALKKRLP